MNDQSTGPEDPNPEDRFLADIEWWLKDRQAEWLARLELELRLDDLAAAADPEGDAEVDGAGSDEQEWAEVEVDAEGQDPDERDGAPEPAAPGAGGPPPPEAGGTGNGADDGGWSADGVEPQLRRFVTWLVPTLELWEKIPACWAAHPAMVEELRVAHHLYQAALAVTDPAAAGRVRADWQDYLGRVLDRLAASPGGGCAQRGEHRVGRTWDRQDSALKRRAARQTTPTPPSPRPGAADGPAEG